VTLGGASAKLAAADAVTPLDRVHEQPVELDWNAYLPSRAAGFSWRAQQRIKRVLDLVLAGLGLIILTPFLLAVAALIKLTSPGPVLYEWRVLGRRARPFVGYKFRTMVSDADIRKASFMARNEMSGPVFKLRDDPRVTPVGRWLRKYSIDELPQLWSVVRGDMSLVGPRPAAPEEFARYEPWQCGKLAVTPGITCTWQVSGRSEISDFNTWARLDIEYIRNWNLALDLRILLRTLPAVISARGAY
jgi:lipopolysaccharide/colanic/teichoic acid biosynthesis glycosyltransferase